MNKTKKMSVFSKSSVNMCDSKRFCKEESINLLNGILPNEICYMDKKNFE